MHYFEFTGSMPSREPERIAEIDLNDDGLMEIILELPDKSLLLLAMPPRRSPVLLGKIPSSKGALISDTHDFGVRRILTTGSPTSDYSQATYRWNPYQQQYELTT